MADSGYESDFVEHFHSLARTSLPRAPLHSALSAIIGRDRSLADLLRYAPESQRQPVLLLAVIHSLVLATPEHPLTSWYPALTDQPRPPDDPGLAAALSAFIHERHDVVRELVSWRRTQTNEVGRCAFLFAAMAPVAERVGPLAHIDVGTSAGLNLLLPHFSYRFDDDEPVGHGDILLECGTTSSSHRPNCPIDIALSVGIDSAPLDPTNLDDARWLKACVWPDQIDRFRRLDAAIELANQHRQTVLVGDGNELLANTVREASGTAHPVVTTSWVLNYFSPVERTQFLARLDELGADLDMTWIFAESPAQTPELPHADDVAGEHLTSLTTVSWHEGARTVTHNGTCHPHGYWIRFR